MRSLQVQQVGAVVVAPAGEDPKIGRIAASCGIGVTGDERGDGDAFGDDHRVVVTDDFGRVDGGVVCVGHAGLLE